MPGCCVPWPGKMTAIPTRLPTPPYVGAVEDSDRVTRGGVTSTPSVVDARVSSITRGTSITPSNQRSLREACLGYRVRPERCGSPWRLPTPTRWSACCRTVRRSASSTRSTSSPAARRRSRRRYRVTGDEAFLAGPLPRQPGLPGRDPARGARPGGCDRAPRRRPLRGEAAALRRGGEGPLAPAGAAGRRARCSRSTSSGSAPGAVGPPAGPRSTARPPARRGCSSRSA